MLIPVAALVGAALLGGLGAVGVWEAASDDEPAASSAVDGRATAAAGDSSLGEIYRRAAPGVVELTIDGASEGEQEQDFFGLPPPGRSGSGFVIDDDGHIVTNHHVVDGADTVGVTFANGDEGTARVVGSDPSSDIALLELEDAVGDLTPLEFGSTTSLEVGDPVVAIGSPFGLEGTLTAGIVSALDRDIRAPNGFTIDGAVQTDAAINSGNSGGPLLDGNGRVIGVASQIQSESGGNVGIGYAVPVETVRSVVDQLLADGEVEHAYLGVRLEASDTGGAVLADVVADGPADRAGLEDGDVVTAIDGEEIESADELRNVVAAKQPGDTVKLELRRGDNPRTIDVELGTRPDSVE
ncbi:MAG: S1C family serine protease [Gaiellaceae bacterium]